MTKSTITREQLEEWVEQFDEDGGCDATDRQLEALIRQSLAVMDSEPVAYIFKHPEGRLFWSLTDESNKGHDDVMPVYVSPQPAPIVEREPIAWLNDAYLARGVVDGEAGSEDVGPGYIPVYRHAQPAPVVPEEMPCGGAADDYHDGYQDGWNACRAAMLAAAPQLPGGEPATVPGKWIPVSERMPDDDDFVYIWPRPDFGVELHVGQYCERSHKGGGWYAQVYEQNYGIEWHPITVTHWMPLPAAPQEVK
ncbi:DUF551 domain-containing protein [Klebsiella variicola]|uniref:DUF551 domain-containing protein n=1 Tax=Klebsiella variicola TaxID=244366 RepID=UPI0020CBF9C4|nr:DUF551 domain-containing protein [Klebsiella variicola]